jgi:hypothetical protein
MSEAEELASQCLSRHTGDDAYFDEICRAIDAEKASAKSIAESPVWKDPEFLKLIAEGAAKSAEAKRFEKSREETRHYIDSTSPQPRRANRTVDGKVDLSVSMMGYPKRGVDGLMTWDAPKVCPKCGHPNNLNNPNNENCPYCGYYWEQNAGPTRLPLNTVRAGSASRDRVDGSIDHSKNRTADGRVDVRKSILGNPVRQADGSIKWVVD